MTFLSDGGVYELTANRTRRVGRCYTCGAIRLDRDHIDDYCGVPEDSRYWRDGRNQVVYVPLWDAYRVVAGPHISRVAARNRFQAPYLANQEGDTWSESQWFPL